MGLNGTKRAGSISCKSSARDLFCPGIERSNTRAARRMGTRKMTPSAVAWSQGSHMNPRARILLRVMTKKEVEPSLSEPGPRKPLPGMMTTVKVKYQINRIQDINGWMTGMFGGRKMELMYSRSLSCASLSKAFGGLSTSVYPFHISTMFFYRAIMESLTDDEYQRPMCLGISDESTAIVGSCKSDQAAHIT